MSVVTPATQIGDALEHYTGLSPQSNAASGVAVNGTGIDRISGDAGAPYESMDLVGMVGTHGGSVGTKTIVFKLQHSALVGSGYVDYVDPTTGVVPSVSITADVTTSRVKVNLKGALQFIRVVCTPTFTTETSEQIGALMVLGGSAVTPTP